MSGKRSFRPELGDVLEGRIVLSRAGVFQPFAPAVPYYEQLVTTYSGGKAGSIVGIGSLHGKTEVDYRMEVVSGIDATTTTDDITLPGNAGRETIVKTATIHGNTTETLSNITLPDGVVATRTTVAVVHGNTTTITGTLDTPGIGTQTFRGTIVRSGSRTISNTLVHMVDGQMDRDHEVTTQITPYESISVSTTTMADGKVTGHVKSKTLVTPFLMASA